jgi:predicted ATP-grasp superfamily ATP-dependent carboligase
VLSVPKILVTDSSERASLAIIRSLGKKKMEITAADSINLNAGFLSKYTSHSVVYPSPQEGKKKFADFMLRLVKNEHFDILIPVTDFAMIPLLERRDEFEEYVRIAGPRYDIAMKAFDKAQTIQIAKENSIPCPKTFFVKDFEELINVAKVIRYPVVIKPRMKIFWSDKQTVMLKVTSRNYAYTPSDLLLKYKTMLSEFCGFGIMPNFFMIQEFASGTGYGVEILMHDSKVKAAFVHKRIREYPVKGGASTLRVSIENTELYQYAVKLLNAMHWEGVAMVEFKLDSNSGTVNLMEVNGRFWGSLPLSINAGVDFPYLLYKCILEENFDIPGYRIGVTQRWLIPGDLLWLYSSIVYERKTFNSIRDFISSFSVADDILSLDDPKPILGTFRTSFSSLMDVAKGRYNISGESRI